MEEEYRKIAGHDNYSVSNLGNVRNDTTGKILKGNFNRNMGYYCVELPGQRIKIHRLVGITFIPNPEGKPFIDHIDRNKTNNVASNLRWATERENSLNRTNSATEPYIKLYKRLITKPYQVQIKIAKKVVYNEYFTTLEEAKVARDDALEAVGL